MITRTSRTLFALAVLSMGFAYPTDEAPVVEVVQAKATELGPEVKLTTDEPKIPFLPTPTPSEIAPPAQALEVRVPVPQNPVAPPVEAPEDDLAPSLDGNPQIGEKSDLDTANTFWGGYGGWGWRRPYYGGWGRGWGGGYGGYGGYGYGRSYYRPWGYGGWRW